MSIFMLSVTLTTSLVVCMVGIIAGGIPKIIAILSLIAVTLYFFIFRVQNKINEIHGWLGKTTGVITTSHPGGWIQVEDKSIYRESYIEYQFQHAGKMYISTCVEPIFDVRGSRQPNLSAGEIAGLSVLTMLAKTSSAFQTSNQAQSLNSFDSNDETDVIIRQFYDTCKVGDEITVYYDINNPEKSVLIRRKSVRTSFKLSAGYMIVMYLMLAFI